MKKQLITYLFFFICAITISKATDKLPIIIKLIDGNKVAGNLIAIKDSSIIIFNKEFKMPQQVEIKYFDIDRIYFEKHYIKQTTLLAGLICTIAGGVIGYAQGDDNNCGNSISCLDFSKEFKMLFGGFAGGTVGAFSGFIIGVFREVKNSKRIIINADFQNFVKSKEIMEKNLYNLKTEQNYKIE